MLVSNWRDLVKRAWSIRLMILAGLMSGLEVALPFVEHLVPIPNGLFAVLAALTTAGAFVARLLAQKNLSESP